VLQHHDKQQQEQYPGPAQTNNDALCLCRVGSVLLKLRNSDDLIYMPCPIGRAEIVNDGFLVLGNTCAQIFHSTYTPLDTCTAFDALLANVELILCAGKLCALVLIFHRILGSELTCHETPIFSNRLEPSFCQFTLHHLFTTNHNIARDFPRDLLTIHVQDLHSITHSLAIFAHHLRCLFCLCSFHIASAVQSRSSITTMAPVAQTTPSSNDVGSYDGSRPRFQSLQAWLEIYGGAEYAVYKKDHAPSDLEYEEWATSVHAHGMYLWHAALDVWEEPSSSVSH